LRIDDIVSGSKKRGGDQSGPQSNQQSMMSMGE
jgi:hypothetical protein